MTEFLTNHPYLIANLPVLLSLLACAAVARPSEYKKMAWKSGWLCLPGSFAALLHNASYWNPVRVGNGPIGIEDFLFTLTVGLLAWLLAGFPFRRRLRMEERPLLWATRLGISYAAFCVLCGCLWLAGVESLPNTLGAGGIALVLLLLLRPDLWILAAAGSLLFTTVYLFLIKLQFAVWPNFVLQWNPNGTLGTAILGIPSGEIVFAVLFGAGMPVYMAFLFDVTIRKVPPHDGSGITV